MTRKALIIGITGGFGSSTATALLASGWEIRALCRDPDSARERFGDHSSVEWIRGDAMLAESAAAAAAGVDVIVHGANPPGYKNWRGLAIPMLKSSIEAARASGARIVFPGNVYNFGPDAFPLLTEESTQSPRTRKGTIRVEMEALLEQAASSGVRVLIVRAGDFFGPVAPGSWMQGAMVKPGKPVRSVTYPGDHEVGHAWAFLPDLGETVAQLLGREAELEELAVFHFGGHYVERGVDFAHAIGRAAGLAETPIKKVPWPVLRVLSPFVRLFRELLEMRYLWQEAVELDNSKLVAFLGREPHTPLSEALTLTLAAIR